MHVLKNRSIIIFTAIVSGLSVFINSLAVKQIPNAYFFTTAKNIVVSLLLASLLLGFGKWKEIKELRQKDWLHLFILGFIGGSVPFLLFFQGISISKISALNGAFIQKTLFVWVALMAVWFFREKLTSLQVFALAVIFLGTFLAGGIKFASFGQGELLVFLATILWSIEAIYVSRFVKGISPEILAFGRMFFGSLMMLSFVLISQPASVFVVTKSQISWIFLTAGFLLIYVWGYYKSLVLFKATEVTAILTLAFPITVIAQNIYISKSIPNILALTLVAVGVVFYFFQTNLQGTKPSKRTLWKA